ncbi:TetR/AcrR family transcriptional regulator [Nonomuraea thailandensis]
MDDQRHQGDAERRIDKRQAILEGAFTVFAREGYAQACVQSIAREAGVAKPTVYNHMTDKATLFRHAMEAAARDILDIVQESGPDRLNQALADRLARLALAGRLRAADPDLAAEQFLALLLGPLEARTQLGTRQLQDAELRTMAVAAVDAFVRAWGAR